MFDVLFNLTQLPDLSPVEIVSKIGGKGFGLSQILAAGLPAPATWVVSSSLLNEFRNQLQGGEALAKLVEHAEKFVAERLSKQLGQLPEMPYAVRSSATVEDFSEQSFAGMFESRLGVAREDIPEAVAGVWLSGLAGRVEEYRHSSSWPEMAVLIQPMVRARYAGVCFSAHPSPTVLAENHHVLIELVTGLGDKLVQGEATPVRLSGRPAVLASATDYPWVRELLVASARLEAMTGMRVDMEFAVDDSGALCLLQQRPVTAAACSHTLSLTGYRKAYKRALSSLDIEFLIDGCVRYLAPYLEVPADLTTWMVMITSPKDGQQELWVNEFCDDLMIREVADLIRYDECYLERLEARFDHHYRRILAWQSCSWADASIPLPRRLQDFFEFIAPLNAHYYAPMHIIEALSRLLLDSMRTIAPATADDDFHLLATSGIATLGGLFARELGCLRRELLCEGMNIQSTSALPSSFRGKVDALVENYGFLNCRQPFEPPYTFDDLVAMLREAGEDPEAAGQPAIGHLKGIYGLNPGWERWAAALNRWLNLRNQQMEYLYYAYAKAAPLLQEVGNLLGLTLEQVWSSSRSTLLAGLDSGDTPAAPDRKKVAVAHDGKRVLVSDRLHILHPEKDEQSAELRGRTVFGEGEICGRVVVAFTPDDLFGIEHEPELPIIVTGMTTPDFVPFLAKRAGALITDEGGILCHASIIAREIRLPCIVGTGVATEKLQGGMRVRVDLDRGTISVLPSL